MNNRIKRTANLLARNKKILATYKKWKDEREFSDHKIWERYIYPEYYVSLRTFRHILTINVKLEEKKIASMGVARTKK